jgi:hypothetical protein
MSVSVHIPIESEQQDAHLATDERWLLVQRIVASESLQRSGQLRKILVYVSRLAIQHPEIVVREYEIACNVLDRRKDFNPADDNIVRAQFTHLRRKLERYFSEEGMAETLCLTIPKGSYIPVFAENAPPRASALPSQPAAFENPQGSETPVVARTAPPVVPKESLRWGRWIAASAAVVCVVWISILTINLRRGDGTLAKSEIVPSGNGFVQLLARSEGNVSVVLPDTSQMMIQYITDMDISAADYANSDFPQQQLATVKDPEARRILSQLATKRNTTVNEAKMGFDVVEALTRAGGHGTIRYARDLHVRDLTEGNTILIGSQRSNPWVSLFTSKTNFQYMRNPVDDSYIYKNMKPLPGEDPVYHISTESGKDRVNYVDIAFMQNPVQSGYILLLIGTDLESGEAASKFLLHGRLPPEITALLARKDLREFEIFLRGRHIIGESEDALEVVAIRPKD